LLSLFDAHKTRQDLYMRARGLRRRDPRLKLIALPGSTAFHEHRQSRTNMAQQRPEYRNSCNENMGLLLEDPICASSCGQTRCNSCPADCPNLSYEDSGEGVTKKVKTNTQAHTSINKHKHSKRCFNASNFEMWI